MATKVQLFSIDGKESERVKRSKAESLVRRLLAIEITAYIFQRVAVHSHPTAKLKPIKPKSYQHHIEPKIFRVNRREMEELESWANMIAAGR